MLRHPSLLLFARRRWLSGRPRQLSSPRLAATNASGSHRRGNTLRFRSTGNAAVAGTALGKVVGAPATPSPSPAPPPVQPVLPAWLVRHPRAVALVPVLGNVAYASLAGGFLCSDVLHLRLLLVCGYSGLVAYHALRPRPLRIPLRWSAFFVAVNLSMAAVLVLDQMPPTLTEEEEELHVHHFSPLRKKQFRALMDIGHRVTYADGEFLTRAREPRDRLFFVLSGKAHLVSPDGGRHISTLRRGGFPNSMAFCRSGWSAGRMRGDDGRAYATIRCEGAVECLVWDRDDLLALLAHAPGAGGAGDDDMRRRLDHAVIESAIRRLLVDAEGAEVKDYIRTIAAGWADKEVQQQKIQSMRTVPNSNS